MEYKVVKEGGVTKIYPKDDFDSLKKVEAKEKIGEIPEREHYQLDPEGKVFSNRSPYGDFVGGAPDMWYEFFGTKEKCEILCSVEKYLTKNLLRDTHLNFIEVTLGKSPTFFWGFLIIEEYQLVIRYNGDENTSDFVITGMCANSKYCVDKGYREKVDMILDYISESYYYKRIESKPKMRIIVPESGGLTTKLVDLDDKVNVNIDQHYNDDFKEVHNTILERFRTKGDKGIVLLWGDPGTSKSTYLRYMTSLIKDKTCIYLPNSIASKLASPEILALFLNYKDSILIIEDAEDLLLDRGANYNKEGVSNLLNISDGLLSDVLNIQIVCTFNCDISKIDKALMRKGRLIASYKFGPLSVDKSNNLLKELGHNYITNSPMVSTDIFNFDEKKYQTMERPKIGFK